MNSTIGIGLYSFLLALTLIAVVAVAAVLLMPGPASSAPGDDAADRVFGQGGSFTSHQCNLGGASASSLCNPSRAAVDGAGNLYVVDSAMFRVLEYDSPLTTDTVADRVFGQAGSFTSGGCNVGGISAASLCQPIGVGVDTAGDLYVGDNGNNRVLEYHSPLTTDTVADSVFGQPDFTSSTCAAGLNGLCNPSGISLDAADNLYVADTNNSRVLEYNSPLTTDTVADRVFGQSSCGLSPSASSFCTPTDVAVDGEGNLYVADLNNSRALQFDSPLTTDTVADRVFGQGGSFTSGACNLGGISAASLCLPIGVGVDNAGDLYIADYSNSRVLKYDGPLTTDTVADRVFGQGGSFMSNSCPASSASSLCFPSDAHLDSSNNLYVADRSNHRVLEYDDVLAPTGTPTPCAPEGCPTPTPTFTATPTATPCQPAGCPTPTPTRPAVPTYTNTPVSTATNTPVPTATNTTVPTATNTPVPPTPTPCGGDADCDGEPNPQDNCPNWPNPAQNLPPWPVPANDPDCDGFSTAVENAAGTNPLVHCGAGTWPADITNNTFSDVGDIAFLTGNFGASVPPAPARYNIAPDPVDGFIDTTDIARMTAFFGLGCS